jgi:hypothetical protein
VNTDGNPSVPPHYTAFRVTLVVLLLGVLCAVGWWITRPGVLAEILRLLGAH